MVSLGNGFQDPCWCQKLEDKHISFWFVLLHVIVPCKYCRVWLFLRDWRLVTALYQAGLSALFFQQRLLISCLCHISVILTIPQVFSLLLCLRWWSIISNLWCYCCNCLGAPQNTPIWNHKFDKCYVFCLLHWPAVPPSLFISVGLLIPWDTETLKLSQLITQQWPLSIQEKGRVTYLSH